jgi:hypothetical protein
MKQQLLMIETILLVDPSTGRIIICNQRKYTNNIAQNSRDFKVQREIINKSKHRVYNDCEVATKMLWNTVPTLH